MDKTLPCTLNMAMKDFFGMRPGTGLKEFLGETKALTPADKDEIKVGLIANGYNIQDNIQ